MAHIETPVARCHFLHIKPRYRRRYWRASNALQMRRSPNATNDRRVIQVAGVNDAIYRACDRRNIRLRHAHCRNRVDVKSAVGRADRAGCENLACSCRKGLPANPVPRLPTDRRTPRWPSANRSSTSAKCALEQQEPIDSRSATSGWRELKIAYQPVCKPPSIPTILHQHRTGGLNRD